MEMNNLGKKQANSKFRLAGDMTSRRKADHIRLCLEREVEFGNSGFDDVRLVHNALPEIDLAEIDTRCELLGHGFDAPIFVEAMTGGHPDATNINRNLAAAVQSLGLGMGVGSQRAALEDPAITGSFDVVREAAPDAFIAANIGAPQLRTMEKDAPLRAVEMLDADALCIHLNFLQEAVQPEGDAAARGCLAEIKRLCAELPVPVIVKETGAGISHDVAHRLCDAGVAAIDVAGWGGTSWSAVEALRAGDCGDLSQQRLGTLFRSWGIPTTASIVEAKQAVPVIASGGVRSGMDVASSIALGASIAGTALPLLRPATMDSDEVESTLKGFINELKCAMFCCGTSTLDELSRAPLVIGGYTMLFLEQRGFDVKTYTRR